MSRKLTQQMVTRYGRYKALVRKLEHWLDARKDEFLVELEAGASCPNRGPYLLEVSDVATQPSWRDEFRNYLLRTGKSAEDADGFLARIVAKPREEHPRLLVKVNPAYRGTVTVKLPVA